MQILPYLHDTTPCPYRDGVIILSSECRACKFYAGECVTQHIRCQYNETKGK